MFHKRQYSQQVSQQQQKLQVLKSELSRQLQISTLSEQKCILSPNLKRVHLPSISKAHSKFGSHNFGCERTRYQHNLRTNIVEKKDCIDYTKKAPYCLAVTDMSSHLKEIHKGDFRITTINLCTQRKNKNSLTRSYVEATERRLADEKKKRRQGFQRFTFQPWLAHQEKTSR